MDELTRAAADEPAKAAAGRRAREAPPPAPERLRELARAVRSGDYAVPPERLAEALLRALRARAAPPD